MRILFLFLLLLISACSSDKPQQGSVLQQDDSVQARILYQSSLAYLNNNNTKLAVDSLEVLSSNYPYTNEGVDAQAMLIWVYFQNGELDNATDSINAFLRYYPTNEYVPWVLYMQTVINYDRVPDSKLSQEQTQKALKIINELQQRYSTTIYAQDAFFRQDLMLENIAGQNLYIGKYYQRNNNIASAINRYQEIVEYYSTTRYIPEAMYRLVECWLIFGVYDEAYRTLSVMGYNYGANDWYKKAYDLFASKADINEYQKKFQGRVPRLASKS